MKKLRIHKMPYVNQGTANINLKGVTEYHAIFKFDTDEEATDFIRKVKEWHNGEDKIITTMGEVAKNSAKAMNQFSKGIGKLDKQVKKSDETKKPVPKKRKAGRPAKADIQGQKR